MHPGTHAETEEGSLLLSVLIHTFASEIVALCFIFPREGKGEAILTFLPH